MQSPKTIDLVRKSGSLVRQPSLFNGLPIVGAQSQEEFEKIIDDELVATAKLISQEHSALKVYDKLMATALDHQPTPAEAGALRKSPKP